MGMETCRLFSEGEIDHFKKTRKLYLNDVSENRGFAETFSTFGRITSLESSIPKLICTSRVPARETRKLLRCRSPQEASNVPVFQFMRRLFNQIGFSLSVQDIDVFTVALRVKPPIYDSPSKQKKTCFTTAEAILRFFFKDLKLKCEVEEIECINEGAEFCIFKCTFEFLSLCRIALDEHDKRLIRLIAKNMAFEELLRDGFDKDEDALRFRLDIIKEYEIIDSQHRLSDRGREFLRFLEEVGDEEDDFEPPWKDIKDISSVVSEVSSFAEALKESSDKDDGGKKNG